MKVTALYVYPVKGLRGIPLTTAVVGPQGIRHDRRIMLLTRARNKAGTLHTMQLAAFPECALFSQAMDGDEVVVTYHPAVGEGLPQGKPGTTMASMASVAPPPLRMPLDPDPARLAPLDVSLHGSAATGCRLGATYDAWFSECFGFEVIVAFIGGGRRPVLGETLKPKGGGRAVMANKASKAGKANKAAVFSSPPWPPSAYGLAWLPARLLHGLALLASYVVAMWWAVVVRFHRSARDNDDPWLTFVDVAPLLVTAESSRRNVNARLSSGVDVPMYKFRPNIVVDGAGEGAWAEDFWAELEVGGVAPEEASEKTSEETSPQPQPFRLLLTSNCARCTSLNVDYRTGGRAAGELGEVLKRMSTDRRVDAGMKYSPVFGRYAFLDGDGEVRVRVGDDVAVTQRNAERTVWDWPL